MDPNSGNRKMARYSCNYTAYLQIICPELTFTPRPIYVQAVDLSHTGCRIITKAINPDFYKLLMVEVRQINLEMDLKDGRHLALRGKLVWVEYREQHASLGISFHALGTKAEVDLAKLLEELRELGAIYEIPVSRPPTSISKVTT